MVAKLLYLCKRVRPDILLAVQFLTTRVKNPTKRDDYKLRRVIGYVTLTKYKRRFIDGNDEPNIFRFFIDAAFACHDDGKGQSALVGMLGNTAVITMCRKHKIATRESTEAELVALSDMMLIAEWAKEFMMAQGFEMKTPIIYQDNTSTITLVTTKTGGKLRTKHINARRAAVLQDILNERFIVKYINTKKMIADVLTKPLGGQQFKYLISFLMGKYRTSNTGVRCAVADAEEHANANRSDCGPSTSLLEGTNTDQGPKANDTTWNNAGSGEKAVRKRD